ncbi:MAG TPA: carboxypeptidase regulatory-like domain-containing protein, partial [Polyangiaceae bacterium]|nr:carboxypeptidase regulatory-like domain-containing protein [Polyangiaceae bacterium]
MTKYRTLSALGGVLVLACSANSPSNGGSGSGSGAASSSGGNGTGGINTGTGGTISTGGQLNVGECTAEKTTVSGTVYDPAGRVPLYNVVVYVPTPGSELPPISDGAACDTCSGMQASGVAVALSDSSGHFVLEGVPPGESVPLVIQVGKWRRETTIPSVVACQDNTLTDPELTRLPRNQSEGHIPRIAVSTGHS